MSRTSVHCHAINFTGTTNFGHTFPYHAEILLNVHDPGHLVLGDIDRAADCLKWAHAFNRRRIVELRNKYMICWGDGNDGRPTLQCYKPSHGRLVRDHSFSSLIAACGTVKDVFENIAFRIQFINFNLGAAFIERRPVSSSLTSNFAGLADLGDLRATEERVVRMFQEQCARLPALPGLEEHEMLPGQILETTARRKEGGKIAMKETITWIQIERHFYR